MHGKKARFVSHSVLALAVMFGLVVVATQSTQAQTFTVLYSFTGGSDGDLPESGVVQDASGNLYGTTFEGGNVNCGNYDDGCGVVYEVSTAGTETVLHTFCQQGGCGDGANPRATVIRDMAGNLYGTGYEGGKGDAYGTVFKIDTAGNETVLQSFHGQAGCLPAQGLLVDKSGTIFGTTSSCGSYNYGTLFEVSSAGKFTILHSFDGMHGAVPAGGHLTVDESGNLYGVTLAGGHDNYGVLYKLSKDGAFTVLHSFAGGTTDGCYPEGSVVEDEAGNLYGTAPYCGSSSNGAIWKVTKTGKETIVHNFAGGTSDGCNPLAGVFRDSKGNLYGVTMGCGANSYGALYELSAKGGLTLLHSFDYSDGSEPTCEVLRTEKGTLFGTTNEGGAYGGGTVWKLTP